MDITREYKRLRKLGHKACDAYRAAVVSTEFEALEHDGRVSLELAPDLDADLSYLEQDHFTDYREEIYARANEEGCWGVVVKVEGAAIDSVWGFIGDDWKDSGHDTDLKLAAIEAAKSTPSM